MKENSIQTYHTNIIKKIFTIRDKQVMLDEHLAELYDIETKYLNRAVKRNPERFPESFMFQLTKEEYEDLRCQIGTSKKKGGRRYYPFAFTEQGVAMLSALLNSVTAIKMSIAIMNAFVEMRHFLMDNTDLLKRIQKIEVKQTETDNKMKLILDAMKRKELKQQYGIFFNGQIFDAWLFISELIKSSQKSLILIDNYIDDSVLSLFAKKNKNVSVDIYTKNIGHVLREDVNRFNNQYGLLSIHKFEDAHDRFLLIDKTEVYHLGASLKDLGKKWFAFSKINKSSIAILKKLEV